MLETPRKIEIIYASASGNVETVCEKINQLLISAGFQPSVHRAEVTRIELIKDNSLFIFATSTWEHGEISPYFHQIMGEMKETQFYGKFAGFVGLGDTRYEPVLFCGGMIQLQELFESQGGVTISVPLKINGDPHPLLDTMVTDWCEKFVRDVENFDFRGAEIERKGTQSQVKMPEELPEGFSV